ncbi:hypothetical protein R3P38DRAFT_3219563 [Favolaschia claudopus]|uniref:Uncharacterized protein n=1 Tax=Favolaschia claudopus TaxID=2862362 RepID=A0AAW0A2D2_9AGAR
MSHTSPAHLGLPLLVSKARPCATSRPTAVVDGDNYQLHVSCEGSHDNDAAGSSLVKLWGNSVGRRIGPFHSDRIIVLPPGAWGSRGRSSATPPYQYNHHPYPHSHLPRNYAAMWSINWQIDTSFHPAPYPVLSCWQAGPRSGTLRVSAITSQKFDAPASPSSSTSPSPRSSASPKYTTAILVSLVSHSTLIALVLSFVGEFVGALACYIPSTQIGAVPAVYQKNLKILPVTTRGDTHISGLCKFLWASGEEGDILRAVGDTMGLGNIVSLDTIGEPHSAPALLE